MQDARSAYDQTYARFAGQISIRRSGIACSLLVPKSNEADTQVDGLFSNVNDGYANDSEENRDTQIAERPRYEIAS